MNQDLQTFYSLTQRTRAKVLAWLETLPPDVFTMQNGGFTYGSLSVVQAHVAECYLWWVGTVGLGAEEPTVKADNVHALRDAFAEVDATFTKALDSFVELDAPFIWRSPSGEDVALSRRWLILHPITHEFHHKGQALALARAIGYPHPGNPNMDLADPS